MSIELFVPHSSPMELLNSALAPFTLVMMLVVALCLWKKDRRFLNRSTAWAVAAAYLVVVLGGLVLPVGLNCVVAFGGLLLFVLHQFKHRPTAQK